MIRLSAIERFGALPTPVRSSGTCATPRRMASRAERLSATSPVISMRPWNGRNPVTTWASSLWPLPATPPAPVAPGAPGNRRKSGHDLGQLALAVAGHARDAQDLTGPHVEGDAAQGRQPLVVLGVDIAHGEHDRARTDTGPLHRSA